ncbi:MAG TPA: hypothetical protein VG388_07755 [Solirubrobacteraceae bacterium]|jgi:hypothetical protein|nr:hypothetical protein [Solirubrobacteraceae bacterium]
MKNSALRLAARDASPFSRVGLTHLVDDMIDGYVSWREECRAVDASYQNWSRAEREDRELAFTAYLAALDREERAAAMYRSLAERIPLT